MTDQRTRPRLDRAQLSLGVEVTRPLLILLMCLAHIPLLHHYIHESVGLHAPASLLGPFLKDVLSRATVPALTAIAGYLAWQSSRRRTYPAFVLEKSRRILVPFLLWNLIALGLVYLLLLTFGISYNGHPERIQSPMDLALVLLPYNAMPVNVPTYFLRDLLLILLCVPLFRLITHRLWVGLLAAAVLLGLMLTVLPLSLNLGGHGILYRNDMPLFFLFGFLAARHARGIPAIRVRPAGWVLAAALLACLLVVIALGQLKPSVETYVRFRPLLGLGALAVLPFAFSLIAAGRNRWPVRALQRLSPYSYSIFLSHFLIAILITANLPGPVSRWLHGLQIDNWAPLWLQCGFIVLYLGLCIGLGWTVKTLYDQLARREADPASP